MLACSVRIDFLCAWLSAFGVERLRVWRIDEIVGKNKYKQVYYNSSDRYLNVGANSPAMSVQLGQNLRLLTSWRELQKGNWVRIEKTNGFEAELTPLGINSERNWVCGENEEAGCLLFVFRRKPPKT